ncbi:PEP-CTERM sorting domain-containing protein [Rubripirellula tenax]|uniref:PEP-CTERM sorting domain-containing protein n=1 Tax=Rubripirellula tenax TaxID=2528015 RepID=UPI0016456012|nr:PEP-CTERM sorting domain-containing protein [Rubripirellula tenax]
MNVLSFASGNYDLTLSPGSLSGLTLGDDLFTPIAVSSALGSLRVVAVPEPSSVLALGMVVAASGWRWRRRYRS